MGNWDKESVIHARQAAYKQSEASYRLPPVFQK